MKKSRKHLTEGDILSGSRVELFGSLATYFTAYANTSKTHQEKLLSEQGFNIYRLFATVNSN